MFKSLFRFLSLFLIIVVISYLTHNWIIDYFEFNSNKTVVDFSYIFNCIYTLILTSGIILVSTKFKDHLGLIFLAGSFIKIGIFLGVSKLSGLEIDKNVFLDFFIPYAICLIFEVYYISRILNNIK